MTHKVEIRTLLVCAWCGWALNKAGEITHEEMRKLAAEKDGWRVVDGEDVCGAFHAHGRTEAGS